MKVLACWADDERQLLRPLTLAPATCIADALAILRDELTRTDPALAAAIDWQGAAVGVFGELKDRSATLREGDRLEIHRPLQIDPKEGRRQRARRLRGR